MVGKTLRTLAVALALAAPAAGLVLPVHDAQATTLAPLSVEQLTDASDYVVRGEILDTWTEVDDRGLIWTRARMRVAVTLKGPDSPAELVISSLGGTYGGQTLHIEARAEFSKFEEAIAFLSQDKSGQLVPVGKFLGKYTVRRAPDTNEFYVRTWHPIGGQPFDARFIPHPVEDQRLLLDTLLDRVSARLDSGWDGKPIPGLSTDRLVQINSREWRKR